MRALLEASALWDWDKAKHRSVRIDSLDNMMDWSVLSEFSLYFFLLAEVKDLDLNF